MKNNIKKYRLDLEYEVSELAEKAETTTRNMYFIQSSETMPRLDLAFKITYALTGGYDVRKIWIINLNNKRK